MSPSARIVLTIAGALLLLACVTWQLDRVI